MYIMQQKDYVQDILVQNVGRYRDVPKGDWRAHHAPATQPASG